MIKIKMLMKSLLILLVFLLPATTAPTYGMGVNSQDSTASVVTNYIIGVTIIATSTDIFNAQAGMIVQFGFPSQYSGRIPSGTLSCSVLGFGFLDPSTWPTPSCSGSGTTVTITNLFTQASTLNDYFDITIQIDSIRNPKASGQTGTFFTYLYLTASTEIVSTTGPFISPTTMTCSLLPSPTSTSTYGDLKVQFTTPEFGSTSTIELNFNMAWPQSNPQSINILPNPATVTCSAVTDPGASASCTFSQITANSYSGSVSSIVTTELNATLIVFSFGPVWTPPSTMPQGSFTLTAKDGGNSMSQCSGGQVNGITSGSLSGGQLTASTKTVNSNTQLSVVFNVNTNLVSTDTITITFPVQIQLTPLTQIYIPSTNTYINGPTIAGQTVNLTGALAQTNGSLTLSFSQIINPKSELPTSTFSIATSRNNYLMDTLTTSLTYSATRASLVGAYLSASNLQLGVTTTYTLQFTLGQPLASDSAVVVGLPPSYQAKVAGCSPAPCSVLAATVTFTSVPTSVGSVVVLTLTGVVNPTSIGSTPSLTLYTLFKAASPTSFVEYTNSGLTVSLVARLIPSANIAIASTSQVVSYFPASFTFTVTNVNQLPANTYAKIYIPVEVGVSASQINCQAGGSAVSCSYDSTTRMVTLSSISASAISAGALVSTPLVVNNLNNPSSTTPTSSFGVYLLNSLDQVVEYQSAGLTFTCSQAANFYAINMILNNTVNSAPTSLSVSFSITASNYVNSSLLAITFPALINIQLASCSALSSNLVSVSCSANGNKLQALLSYSSLSTSTSTQFTVSPYLNYPSLQPYTLTADLYADIYQNSKLCTNANTPSSFQNTAVGQITLASSSFSNSILMESTNLNFQVSAVRGYPFGYLVVSFPHEFGVSTATCSLPAGITCTVQGSSVIINSTTSISLPLVAAINGLTVPSFSPSSSLYLQTFTSTGYLMDSNTQVFFKTACTLPCRTCSVGIPFSCLSCYATSSLVQGQIYLNTTSCVSICGTGLYLQSSTNSCTICTSPCLTCSSSYACYTCIVNYYLSNSSCLNACPFGYYGFNGACLTCSTAIFCLSCPNNYQCSSCIVGYYLYQAQCYQNCPSLVTVPNLTARTCDPCPTNCTQCSGDTTNTTCINCESGYVMDGTRCYLTCVTSGLIAVNRICQGCQSPCSTCSILVTNCTGCLSSGSTPYLYAYRCLSLCPNGYYSDNTTFSCLPCTSPCELCQTVSVHSCLSCISNYYLYQMDCLSTCPATYYNSSGLCKSCISPCLTCTTQTFCASCTNSTFLYQKQCLSQCPSGMTVVNGNECLVCLSSCKTCSSTTYCDTCFSGTYLYNGTCLPICPSGTFPNSTTLVCDSCLSPCQTCISFTFCLSCIDSTLYVINGSCVSCTSPCKTCSGGVASCTSCLPSSSQPYFLNGGCLSICPSSYFSQNTTFSCYPCATPCVSCSGITNSSCLSCESGYYLLGTLCLAVCPTTYYPSISVCSSCVSPCLTCSSISICLSCTNSTYLLGSSCVGSCGSGLTTFNNTICLYCSTACLTCLSVNSSACTSCYSGTYFDANSHSCSSSCPSAFYPDSSTGTGLCLPCLSPCQTCSSGTYCLSCSDPSLFFVNGSCLSCLSPCLTCAGVRTNCTACDTVSSWPYLYSGTCNAGCLFGFYSSNYQCIACTVPCGSCSAGGTSACLTCSNGYYFLNPTCLVTCPSGYYSSTTICLSCISPCLTCSSPSVCLSCETPYYQLGSICVSNCSAGMSIINNTICEYCDPTCLTCLSSNSAACTSCHPTTYLYGTACSSTCPDKTYMDNTTSSCLNCLPPCLLCQTISFCLSCLDPSLFLAGGSCSGCTAPCSTCSGTPTTCTSCSIVSGYPYLFNTSCLNSCTGGYYGESSSGQCLACTPPCQTCSSVSTTSCLTCASGFLFLGGSCLSVCPSGHYSTGVVCSGCVSPCQNCVDASRCTSCLSSYLLEGSSCVTNCSAGLTAINSTICSYCEGSCLSCLSSNTSACTSCYGGLYLLGTICYADCPSGYYESSSMTCLKCLAPCASCATAGICLTCLDGSLFLVGGACQGCLDPCLTCSTLRTNCTSCNSSSSYPYLVSFNCLGSCPLGTYPSGSSCLNCVSPCSTCTSSSTSYCLSCQLGYLLLNSTCLLACPSGYYSDGLSCHVCISPCSKCSSSSVCLSCLTNMYLLGSDCYASCPGGMVITSTGSGGVCVYCDTSCTTCLSANSSYCTLCPNSTYLFQGQCLVNCSSSYYPNSVSYTCNLCISPCATCTGVISCLSCITSSFFLIGDQCMSCQSPCLSCSSSYTTCATCNSSSSSPYYYLSNCLSTCPSPYYPDGSFHCVLCDSPCYTCSSAGSQSCLTCLTGYLMLNSSCLVSCPGGYYNYTNYCALCSYPCLTCTGPGTTGCLSCTSGLYLLGSTCVSNCSGMAVSGSTCLYCSSGCLTCMTANTSFCTSCVSGVYLFNGACLTNCSLGYYPDTNTSACMPCVSPCLLCTSATACLSCIDSTKFLVSSACVGCSAPCYTCSGSVSVCTSCDPLSGFTFLIQGSCLSSCPDTYYQASSSSCLPCTSPCEKCASASTSACLSCVANSFILNGTCYSVCPTGYYSSVTVCALCTSPCSRCQVTASSCLSCQSGYLLRGSSCVLNCSAGEVVVNTTYCSVCSSNCLTCLSSNFSYCTSCSSGTYLSLGSCITLCPNLTYPESATSQCLACLAPCLSCSSLLSCLSCQANLFLVGSSCQSCLYPCLTCSGTQNNCTSCNSSSSLPYFHLNGCLAQCPSSYYDGGAFNCLACLYPCITCSAGTNRSCLSCISGYIQLGSDCYLVCPSGYYSNGTDCLSCNSSLCLTCALSPTTCLSCVSPLFLYGSSCQASCPPGMIVLNNSICAYCSSNCLTCLTLNTSYCTSCLANNYLFNGLCSTTCPDYYYSDTVSMSCLRCLSPCSKCQTLAACLSCSNPLHVLENYTCLSACSYPLVAINGTCYQCSPQCYTCTLTISTCLLCTTSFYYYPTTFGCQLVCPYYVLPSNLSSSGNNECTQICPAGTYYSSSTTPKYCVSCASQCALCVSASNCSQCVIGYSYYQFFCYSPCPAAAPYQVNNMCIMCNISNCQTCLNTTHCQVCVSTYLLIAGGNSTSCIVSCPSGQQYEKSNFTCIDIPAVVPQTNIVESAVPPYTFLMCAGALTFAIFLVKLQYPSSNFAVVMFVMVNLIASAVMANLLYIELTNSGIARGEFSNVSVSTALLISSGGLQLASSLVSVIAIANIRDPELVKIWRNTPVSFLIIMAFALVDSNFVLLTTSHIFELSPFMANIASANMLRTIQFGLISSLLVKGLSGAYSVMQLMYYGNKAYRLLSQSVLYPIERSATLEYLIITGLGLVLVIYLLCRLGKEEKGSEEATHHESHQSLMDQANAFDKRNSSNAEIVMSIDDSDLAVDLHSVKDEKQISDVPISSLLFQEKEDLEEIRIVKAKKITPDQMLEMMNERLTEHREHSVEGEDCAKPQEIIVFEQEESPNKDNNQEESLMKDNNLKKGGSASPQTEVAPTSEEKIVHREERKINNESGGMFFVQNSGEVFRGQNSRIGDISQIVQQQVLLEVQKTKTNIFEEGTEQEEPQDKHRTEILNFDRQDNNNEKVELKHSPSRVSKYQPDQHINNQFAQNSYMDDANRFNEHHFDKIREEGNKITFEVENNDYQEGSREYSFQKRQPYMEPEVLQIRGKTQNEEDNQRRRQSKEGEKRRQEEQDIAEILREENDKRIDFVQIDEEEEFNEAPTPLPTTPIINSFVEDIEDEDQFRPSEGLKGKRRRDLRKKPEIPLPKNETQKQIINIYHKPGQDRREGKKRYNLPPPPSKNTHYVEYSIEDHDFEEERRMPKPIFSGQIRKDAGSRYKSVQLHEVPVVEDEEMPSKPSMKLRKSSFKKIGEMILESQNSSRK